MHVHAHVYQIGRTMAYIKGWMTSEDGRTVFAVCEHHKVHVPARPEHLTYRVKWDEQWEENREEKGAAKQLKGSKL